MLEGIKSRLDVTKEYISNMEDRLMEITQSLQHKEKKKRIFKNEDSWASLVAQWLRICLQVQGTQVWALVWEDPTCR